MVIYHKPILSSKEVAKVILIGIPSCLFFGFAGILLTKNTNTYLNPLVLYIALLCFGISISFIGLFSLVIQSLINLAYLEILILIFSLLVFVFPITLAACIIDIFSLSLVFGVIFLLFYSIVIWLLWRIRRRIAIFKEIYGQGAISNFYNVLKNTTIIIGKSLRNKYYLTFLPLLIFISLLFGGILSSLQLIMYSIVCFLGASFFISGVTLLEAWHDGKEPASYLMKHLDKITIDKDISEIIRMHQADRMPILQLLIFIIGLCLLFIGILGATQFVWLPLLAQTNNFSPAIVIMEIFRGYLNL